MNGGTEEDEKHGKLKFIWFLVLIPIFLAIFIVLFLVSSNCRKRRNNSGQGTEMSSPILKRSQSYLRMPDPTEAEFQEELN